VKAITKGPEPTSLKAHRLSPNSNYDNYAGKDDLRHALVTEQRGLCCYCMCRIRNQSTAMKIEHWQCQAHHTAEQLAYRNLLGACLGGHGQPGHLQHCDTKKGDLDLRRNPADPAHRIEARVRYEPDGTIRADEASFDNHLNDVLNLNLARIKNNRRSVLTALLEWWRTSKRPVPRARIKREIAKRTNTAGALTPYCQVAVWWLRAKLAGRLS